MQWQYWLPPASSPLLSSWYADASESKDFGLDPLLSRLRLRGFSTLLLAVAAAAAAVAASSSQAQLSKLWLRGRLGVGSTWKRNEKKKR